MGIIQVRCEKCGKVFERYECLLTDHTFCSRDCAKEYLSKKMSVMNRELNPTRMREETRKKISESRIKGEDLKENCYPKRQGRHQHRTVAEQILGRPLKPGEVVHHIDGNKHNNDPDNLMVFESQAKHARHHVELRKEAKNAL